MTSVVGPVDVVIGHDAEFEGFQSALSFVSGRGLGLLLLGRMAVDADARYGDLAGYCER